jgi:hypothetical protein
MIESLTPSVNAPLGESRGECERELSSTVSERLPSPEEESKMIYLVSIIKEKILKLTLSHYLPTSCFAPKILERKHYF